MIIFSLDSSSKSASAAVVRDGVILSESFANIGLTHSETLLELCDEALRRASVTPREVDFFAVTSGPGSFTGLRIGMGLIKGMAFATKKPCVGVPTFEALAFGVLGTKRTVVATCDVPPPTSSAYSLPMITGAGRNPRSTVRSPSAPTTRW